MATETKFEKFVRLAEKRIPKMTEAMRLVSQLSSANYESSPEALDALKGVFDESTINLYDAFDLALPSKARVEADAKPRPAELVEADEAPSPVPVAETTEAPATPVNAAPKEDIYDGANYDLPEWKIVREAYDMLLNLTSQEDLDKAVRFLKRSLSL